jgi:Protein of unknown function (DUF3592)
MTGEVPKKPPLPVTGYLALIPLVVGIGMLFSSLSDIAEMRRLELRGAAATGTIVGEVKHDMRHGAVYCPLVRFTAAGGTVVQFRDVTCHDLPHHLPVGAPVLVHYIAEAPADSAAVDQGRSGYWIAAFTGGAGLLSIWLAIAIMRGLRRASPSAARNP